MTKKAYSKSMEKYYYYANDWGSCKERCIVLDNGIMIGSVKCQVCKFNKGHNLKEQWIKCEQINKWIVQKR